MVATPVDASSGVSTETGVEPSWIRGDLRLCRGSGQLGPEWPKLGHEDVLAAVETSCPDEQVYGSLMTVSAADRDPDPLVEQNIATVGGVQGDACDVGLLVSGRHHHENSLTEEVGFGAVAQELQEACGDGDDDARVVRDENRRSCIDKAVVPLCGFVVAIRSAGFVRSGLPGDGFRVGSLADDLAA
jgi:hypothetical protein